MFMLMYVDMIDIMKKIAMTSISMLFIIELLLIHTILLSCIIIECSSFQQPLFVSTLKRSQLPHSSKSIGSNIDADEIDNTYSSENNLQLWIDLRGTSLTPNIALELWLLEDDSNAPFTKCLVSSIEKNAKDTSNNKLDILLVEEDDDTADGMPIIISQAKEHIGRILSLQTSSTSMPILPNDPLSAIDIVSKGQWLLIDTNEWKKVEEDERMSMILPLIDLISSGFTNDTNTSSGGGIGVTCHTNNEVVKIAMYIQSMMNARSGSDNTKTRTLDSGIVVPDTTDNESSSDGTNHNSMMQRFAIIVPFDMELLRTAKLLFADENG